MSVGEKSVFEIESQSKDENTEKASEEKKYISEFIYTEEELEKIGWLSRTSIDSYVENSKGENKDDSILLKLFSDGDNDPVAESSEHYSKELYIENIKDGAYLDDRVIANLFQDFEPSNNNNKRYYALYGRNATITPIEVFKRYHNNKKMFGDGSKVMKPFFSRAESVGGLIAGVDYGYIFARQIGATQNRDSADLTEVAKRTKIEVEGFNAKSIVKISNGVSYFDTNNSKQDISEMFEYKDYALDDVFYNEKKFATENTQYIITTPWCNKIEGDASGCLTEKSFPISEKQMINGGLSNYILVGTRIYFRKGNEDDDGDLEKSLDHTNDKYDAIIRMAFFFRNKNDKKLYRLKISVEEIYKKLIINSAAVVEGYSAKDELNSKGIYVIPLIVDTNTQRLSNVGKKPQSRSLKELVYEADGSFDSEANMKGIVYAQFGKFDGDEYGVNNNPDYRYPPSSYENPKNTSKNLRHIVETSSPRMGTPKGSEWAFDPTNNTDVEWVGDIYLKKSQTSLKNDVSIKGKDAGKGKITVYANLENSSDYELLEKEIDIKKGFSKNPLAGFVECISKKPKSDVSNYEINSYSDYINYDKEITAEMLRNIGFCIVTKNKPIYHGESGGWAFSHDPQAITVDLMESTKKENTYHYSIDVETVDGEKKTGKFTSVDLEKILGTAAIYSPFKAVECNIEGSSINYNANVSADYDLFKNKRSVEAGDELFNITIEGDNFKYSYSNDKIVEIFGHGDKAEEPQNMIYAWFKKFNGKKFIGKFWPYKKQYSTKNKPLIIIHWTAGANSGKSIVEFYATRKYVIDEKTTDGSGAQFYVAGNKNQVAEIYYAADEVYDTLETATNTCRGQAGTGNGIYSDKDYDGNRKNKSPNYKNVIWNENVRKIFEEEKGLDASKDNVNKYAIGIEICESNSYNPADNNWNWDVNLPKINAAAKIAGWLMNKYGITEEEAENGYLCRHHDISGKDCPKPFISSDEYEKEGYEKTITLKNGKTIGVVAQAIIENYEVKDFEYGFQKLKTSAPVNAEENWKAFKKLSYEYAKEFSENGGQWIPKVTGNSTGKLKIKIRCIADLPGSVVSSLGSAYNNLRNSMKMWNIYKEK